MKGGAYAQYTWPFGNGSRFEMLGSWTWIDEVYFSAFEAPRDVADAYSRFDLRGTWFSADEAWTVAAFVNNVLDEIGIRQIDRYQANEDTNFRRAGAVTDPRLFGVEVRYKFGAFQ
jgi:outer membrane receptor protein involved in Fe transport